MTEALLFVHRTREGKISVKLEPASPDYPPPSPSSYYRVSPIFKVRPDLVDDVDWSGEVIIAFYILDQAYSVIAELSARAPHAMPFIWFSHGLASILTISSHEEIVAAVDEIVAVRRIASERWHILAGQLNGEPILTFSDAAPNFDGSEYTFEDYSILPEGLRTIVKESAHSLNKAVWLSRLFMPSELRTYKMLHSAVNEMVTELVLRHSGRASGEGAHMEDRFDHLENRKAVHQIEDRLVQINSALSYLMSQSFAGVVPILQRECLIRTYSLLGVGTAVAGVSALARHVESVFENAPIDLVIEREFRKIGKLDGWYNLGIDHNRDWDDAKRGLDEHLSEVGTLPHVPKLVYFSGRLGFREAEFSVSSALHVLAAANTVGWSLMTLTHELLHGHVRELISAILIGSDDDPSSAFDSAFKFYETERDTLRRPNRQRNRNSDSREALGVTQLDSLRFIIFYYCEQVTVFGSLTRPPRFSKTDDNLTEAGRPRLSADAVRDVLETEYRNISEIMVHVLDYNYFYDAQPEVYLPFVWESWSKVPAVQKNVSHYLLSRSKSARHCPGALPRCGRYRQGANLECAPSQPRQRSTSSSTRKDFRGEAC